MFMQTAVVNRKRTDGNGVTTAFTTAGLTFKDDGVGQPSPIGLTLVKPSTATQGNGGTVPINGQDGWALNASTPSATTYTIDPAQQSVPNTYQSLSVSDTYTMYLMYQPPGGVWIALQDVQWEFIGSAAGPAPNWPNNYTDPQADGVTGTPGGGSEFPSWDGLTSSLIWQ